MSESVQDNTGEQAPDEETLAFAETVFEAARGGDVEKLRGVIGQGVPVDLTNARGDTLLILAAYHRHARAVDALLELGADPNRVNDMGQTAISCAVFRSEADIVKELIAQGGDPDLGSHTALQIAQQFGLNDMQTLLEAL